MSRGEALGVIGPSKAGKTTLCLALSGILQRFFKSGHAEGRLSVGGLEVHPQNFDHLVAITGTLLESPFLQISGIKLTVFEEVALTLQHMGIGRSEIASRVENVLAALKIEHLSQRSPLELSGGETKKLALASALVKDPELLVLDQPFSQLDPIGVQRLKTILKRFVSRGKALVIMENEPEHVLALDRVLALETGITLAYGSPDKVLGDTRLIERGFGVPLWIELAYLVKLRAQKNVTHLPTRYGESLAFLRDVRKFWRRRKE
ncbi:energy-coupling factor ABC transporter ATP-binding protein [Acidobacteria bacterium AH-259-G07]|nr:energy-coupling factor ABC transporter ATP-binding protein [Acidobacteria bacterium AH-259-G07]